MAIVKYGAIVTDIKGKVGGQVFQGGRSGGVIRNKPMKRSDPLPGLGDGDFPPKVNLARTAKSWSQITAIERASWDALLGVWTFINKFGEVYNGTAYQIYCAYNLNLLFIKRLMVTTPNTFESVIDLGITLSDYSLSGSWDLGSANAPPKAVRMPLMISRPQNQSKNIGSINFNQMKVFNINAVSSQDIKALYETTIGYAPKIGDKIVVQIWYCYENYPKKQFFQTINSTVVA